MCTALVSLFPFSQLHFLVGSQGKDKGINKASVFNTQDTYTEHTQDTYREHTQRAS